MKKQDKDAISIIKKVKWWIKLKTVYKCIDLYWEVKYAFQRVFRGYDDSDVFNFSDNLADRIVKSLTDFKKNSISYPVNMKPKEWDEIIDKIIDGFKFYSESEEGVYGYVCKLMTSENLNYNEAITIAKKVSEKKKEQMKLLIDYFGEFWD